MSILPTRTSADTNSSADINEVSTEALDKGGTSQLSSLTEEVSPASGDWFIMEDGATGALKKVDSDNMPGSSGVSFASGIIKSGTSTNNSTDIIDTISSWSGSAGAYIATITFLSAKAYAYAQSLTFWKLDASSDHEQVFPIKVVATTTTTVVITMPTNDDLYLGSI